MRPLLRTSATSALCLGLLSCSGVTLPTDQFEIPPDKQTEIEKVADDGQNADGTFVYNEADGSIAIEITATTFECELETGTLKAKVTELTATKMVWEFEDGDGGVTWTRVDGGTMGVAGVWNTNDPVLYLFLTTDGKATIVGTMECGEGGNRNGENCVSISPPTAVISIDGNLSDWESVQTKIDDPMGDHMGADAGADMKALKVAATADALYLLLELHGAPSTNFQARQAPLGAAYRVHIRDSSGTEVFSRMAFNAEDESWYLIDAVSGISAAAGDAGIEWRFDRSLFGSNDISIVRADEQDCGTMGAACTILDELAECGYFTLP